MKRWEAEAAQGQERPGRAGAEEHAGARGAGQVQDRDGGHGRYQHRAGPHLCGHLCR